MQSTLDASRLGRKAVMSARSRARRASSERGSLAEPSSAESATPPLVMGSFRASSNAPAWMVPM